MSDRIEPPWDEATVLSLNAFQASGKFHPYTCGKDSTHMLQATPSGWICPHDDYRQQWAHAFTANSKVWYY